MYQVCCSYVCYSNLCIHSFLIICISTPVDRYFIIFRFLLFQSLIYFFSLSFNFYTALLGLHHPETGLPIFNTYQLDLVCERCKKKTHPERCVHQNKFIPPWKGEEKNKIVRFILKDLVHILKRESLGMISDEGDSLIEPRYIKQFRNAPPFIPDPYSKPPFIMCCLDPNNNGKNEMAMVAMCNMTGRNVVSSFY